MWISEVYMVGGTDSTGNRYVVTDVPQHYDLLDLRNGVTATLGSATIPTGSYTQMRMIVDSGRVTLGNGLLFAGGSATSPTKVPSGGQTGIKVNFSGPVQVTAGQTVLLVDFDVCRSFVFTGRPSAPNGVNFKGEKAIAIENFIRALWRFYSETGFAYLEINPFTFHNGSIVPLDMVAKLDDAEEYWRGSDGRD